MSSSSVSENRFTDGTIEAPNLRLFGELLCSVSAGTEALGKEVDNMAALKETIIDYKSSHIHRVELTKEKISELANVISARGKEMVYNTEKSMNKMKNAVEPYTNSGVASGNEGLSSEMINKCIKMKGTINGIKSTIEKNDKLSENLLKDHNMLNKIEAMQIKALTRHEKVARIQRLLNEFPDGSQLHQIIVLLKLLLLLEGSSEISKHYQKEFGILEMRTTSLFNGITSYVPCNIGELGSNLSTQLSMSNGEINLQSIKDPDEIPVDNTEAPST